jgi:hypothetical protein
MTSAFMEHEGSPPGTSWILAQPSLYVHNQLVCERYGACLQHKLPSYTPRAASYYMF